MQIYTVRFFSIKGYYFMKGEKGYGVYRPYSD